MLSIILDFGAHKFVEHFQFSSQTLSLDKEL